MLAIVRFIFTFVNKERAIFSRYDRAHPHFKWYLGLDAVLSTVLVFGGFALASQGSYHGRTEVFLENGLVAMSSSELVRHVKGDGIVAYWLGPFQGYKYTIDHVDSTDAVIVYYPNDAKLDALNLRKIHFITHKKSTNVMAPLSVYDKTGVVNFVTTHGDTVQFAKLLPINETISVKGTNDIVEIYYSTVQTPRSMMENADALRRIP